MAISCTRVLLRQVELDYSWLTASASMDEWLTPNQPTLPATSAVLTTLLRASVLTGTASLRLSLIRVADTPEDPGVEFAGLATATTSVSAATLAPTLLVATLSAPIPALVRLRVSAQQASIAGAALRATVIVKLTLRGVDPGAMLHLQRPEFGGWVPER